MRKRKRAAAILLVLVMVMSLGSILTIPAHGLVLDPVSWLYPIWLVYGQQAGVTVTSVGGDSFTQGSFNSLFDEWQLFEVQSGNQNAARTISDFVNDVLGYVDIVAGAVFGGSLMSKLRLGAGITAQLDRFWNWIIVDKLGGTTVDSTDFNQSTGNLGSAAAVQVIPIHAEDTSVTDIINSYSIPVGDRKYYSGTLVAGYVEGVSVSESVKSSVFVVGDMIYAVSNTSYTRIGYYTIGNTYSSFQSQISQYDSTTGLYFVLAGSSNIYLVKNPRCMTFESLRDGLDYYATALLNPSAAGSLTIGTQSGTDVLGFPDTDELDYVPADAVIPWNIPYDETKDTNGYLEEAYDKSLDNELTDTDAVSNPPVEGTGTVEDVGSYVVPGLAEVFPFCLPFDVYNFLSALAAEPEAPHFTAELEFPEAIGGTQEIEIDFDAPTWNQLAQLLRLLELFAFCVGLAFVTRSMFIRG